MQFADRASAADGDGSGMERTVGRFGRQIKVPSPDDLPLRATPNLVFRAVRVLVLKPICNILFRVKVEGRENLPDGQFNLVANHSGPLDALFLLHALPAAPQVYFLGDPTSVLLRRKPRSLHPKSLLSAALFCGIWWYMKNAGGIIPVDRTVDQNLAVRDRLGEAGDAGCVTGAFPERTYTWRRFQGPDGLLPFTAKGVYHAAKARGLPVVPATLSGAGKLGLFSPVIVSFSPALDSTTMSVDEMLAASRPAIASRLVRNVPCHRFSPARLHLLEKKLSAQPPRFNALPPRALKEYYPNGSAVPVSTDYRPQTLN